MRCLFIHLKFRHWPLDGSTFIAQAPKFSSTTQFRNGYCTVCVDTRTMERWGWEILEHPSYSLDLAPSYFHLFPNMKKTSSCQTIQITWWCQAWGANMAAWSGSHLLSIGFWEMDFPPRQVSQQRRWLCGKISEVKCNKWMKRHLTMWSYLVAIK